MHTSNNPFFKIIACLAIASVVAALVYAGAQTQCRTYIIWLGYKYYDCSYFSKVINFYTQNKVNSVIATILLLIGAGTLSFLTKNSKQKS